MATARMRLSSASAHRAHTRGLQIVYTTYLAGGTRLAQEMRTACRQHGQHSALQLQLQQEASVGATCPLGNLLSEAVVLLDGPEVGGLSEDGTSPKQLQRLLTHEVEQEHYRALGKEILADAWAPQIADQYLLDNVLAAEGIARSILREEIGAACFNAHAHILLGRTKFCQPGYGAAYGDQDERFSRARAQGDTGRVACPSPAGAVELLPPTSVGEKKKRKTQTQNPGLTGIQFAYGWGHAAPKRGENSVKASACRRDCRLQAHVRLGRQNRIAACGLSRRGFSPQVPPIDRQYTYRKNLTHIYGQPIWLP
jgi:hypothetical protein